MKKPNFLISLVLVVSILIGQAGSVLAAPALQESDVLTGTVESIMLESDPNTGITTVTVEMKRPDQTKQRLRISQGNAVAVGLVTLDSDGNAVINKSLLGRQVEINPDMVIPDQQAERNPVGDALSTFFSDIPGIDYATIMAEREKGAGFSVIAQALWLTKQLGGNADTFGKLLTARETGDYSAFTIDGVTPSSWAQLRKAILDGKKVDKPSNAAANQNNGNNKDKNKKDKDKNNNGKDEDKGKGNNK